jgi:hypothetical protein
MRIIWRATRRAGGARRPPVAPEQKSLPLGPAGNASAFPAPSRISCMQTGLCRMRTESLAWTSPRTGKRISDVRDEGPQSASGRSSLPAETANGPLRPPQTAGKSRVFRGDGELGVSAGLRGGAGRTRTGNQTVISPSRRVPKPARTNTAGRERTAFCCEPSGSVVVLGWTLSRPRSHFRSQQQSGHGMRAVVLRILTLNRHKREDFAAMHSALIVQ